MSYSYSGNDLADPRLALRPSPISMPLQKETEVTFAAAPRPPPGLKADQPLSTSGRQLFCCQDSLRPSTEPVQQPAAQLVTRLSPDPADVAVPEQLPHPLEQQPDPDQLTRFKEMRKKLRSGHSYEVDQ